MSRLDLGTEKALEKWVIVIITMNHAWEVEESRPGAKERLWEGRRNEAGTHCTGQWTGLANARV